MATHQDVAHNWAHQTGRAQRGFNMYYEGDTIYSYGRHFPIARHATTADGEACVLFTTRSYSISTSKHISYTRSALPHGTKIFYVANPDATSKHAHKENYAAMLKEREALLKKATRARQRKAEYLGEAEGLRERANEYSKAFRLGFRSMSRPADIDAALEALAEKERKAQAEKDKRDRQAIRDWCDGADVRPPHTRVPYVRVKDNEVQTSWGIRVPLRRALAIYRLATHCKACGHEYTPKKAQRVGTWPLDRIMADGTVRAGCHIIPLRIQHEAAKLAGLARG